MGREVCYRSLFSIAQTGYSVSDNVAVRKKGNYDYRSHQKPDWYYLAEHASKEMEPEELMSLVVRAFPAACDVITGRQSSHRHEPLLP